MRMGTQVKFVYGALAAAIVAAVVLFALGVLADRRAEAHYEREQAALKAAAANAEVARVATELAGRETARADSVARAAALQLASVRVRRDTVRLAPVPAECEEVVVQRDTLLDDAIASAAKFEEAYETEVVAHTLTRAAYRELRVAYDTLSTVMQARPKPRSRLFPTVTIGPYVGIDHELRPSYGVGVQLGWRVR